MTTFLRAFTLMLAFTGFSALNNSTVSTPTAPTAGSGSVHTMDGSGMSGAPICTNNLPNCGLD